MLFDRIKNLFSQNNKKENIQLGTKSVITVSPETVAAITAAISCFYSQEKKAVPRSGFIVRSIRKRI